MPSIFWARMAYEKEMHIRWTACLSCGFVIPFLDVGAARWLEQQGYRLPTHEGFREESDQAVKTAVQVKDQGQKNTQSRNQEDLHVEPEPRGLKKFFARLVDFKFHP